MDQTLQPVSPAVGVFPEFIAQQPITLVLREKIFSWSGADFGIKDLDGNVIARCRGKFPTLHNKRIITDPEGRPIYHLREKLLVANRTFIAEDEEGKEVFRLVKKRLAFKAKMEVTFYNYDDPSTPLNISLRGGFWGTSADLTLGLAGEGPIVGKISRNPWTAKDIWMDKQTYYLLIPPGIDVVLLAGICICFDQTMNEKHGSGGGG